MSLTVSPIDLGVLAAYLVATVAFGMWIGRGQRNVSEYLLGGRDLPWWAVLGSIVATETSTATFLSVPGIAYARGGDLRFLQLALGYIIGRLIVVAILLPQYFRGDLYTAYEVLQHRFGGATKKTASLIFLVTRNVADGLRLYLAAIVLEEVAGFSLPVSVIVMGVATIVYTMFGGMKSVVWNDCIQLLIYVGGGVLAAVVILDRLPGGVEQFLSFAQQEGKLRVFDPGFAPDSASFSWERVIADPYTLWAGLIGGAFLTLATHGTDQLMVQRYLSARSQRDAGRALALSGVVVLAQFALFLLIGVGLAAYYAEFPPAEPFTRNDRVFAHFIVKAMPVGTVGLTLAAVFAAAMSTLSSSLNSSATALVNDFYRPRFRTEPSQEHLLKASRLLTVFFGVVQIVVGIAARDFAENVVTDVLAIAAITTGIVLGVFLLGVLTRRVNQTAALVGLIAGTAVILFVKFFTPLAWPWYTVVGALSTFAFGILASAFSDSETTFEELSPRRHAHTEKQTENAE
jgi:SSS family transporter